MLGRLAEPTGVRPDDRGKGRGGVVDVEPARIRSVAGRRDSFDGRVASAWTSGANKSTIPRLVLAAVTRAVARTASAISSPTLRRRARRRANTGPSASAERTMSA